MLFVAVKEFISPIPFPNNPIEGVLFNHVYAVPVPEKLTNDVDAPLHTIWFEEALTIGVGLTVIVNVCGIPRQEELFPVNDGVTVIVAVIGAFPLLTALKEVIFPSPFIPNPIDGLLFVQL